MKADAIRETYLSFFEGRDHRRVPSASLVPSSFDPSVLLTTAGMQPFKPYFRGEEQPPHQRLTSCQKCFRTTDIENVGSTARHLTFFEMLGNFSFGDYFKHGAVDFAYELVTDGFGLDPADFWISVFGGDDELGIGPDEEAIECWRSLGIPDERIVPLTREDNFWQAGPTGPSGPSSELYLDRGPAFGSDDERPGDDSDRMLEVWNLVFMQYELGADGSVTPLPANNIDTGMGLERLEAILEDVPSVFETSFFRPLVELGEERSGRSYGDDEGTTRALRILADHGRATAFLIADGVVPSNEDRGYILRRVMRRAIQQARALEVEGPLLPALAERVIETIGDAYPGLTAAADDIARWTASEEESFGRTLEQGERMLSDLVARARDAGESSVPADDVFRLHDTYGFPYEMTLELLGEEGLSVDRDAVSALMDEARERARAGARQDSDGGERDHLFRFAGDAGFESRFVGYEKLEADTTIGALEQQNGRFLVKLPESPFYPEGGGQVSDSGTVETSAGTATVADVYRLGDDQAVAIELAGGGLAEGEPARAIVDRRTRLATMRNHTATHLLHAALRARLGDHVRQAGSYVGPDKLRFDFAHGERLAADELGDIESQVNEWIAAARPVRAVQTTREEAERMGAMALFGEKYGDVVRMVEVEGVSRELCGGTHVATTAEIGLFHMTTETSSASNVRRIEAVTGPAATELFEQRTAELRELAELLRVPEQNVRGAVEKLSEQARSSAKQSAAPDAGLADELVGAAEKIGGIAVVVTEVEVGDPKVLLALSDKVRQTLGDAAVVLASAGEGRVDLVANFAPAAVERGLHAGDVVGAAAEIVGGGGGGRDTMARAGGRDPEKLPEAIAAARARIEAELAD